MSVTPLPARTSVGFAAALNSSSETLALVYTDLHSQAYAGWFGVGHKTQPCLKVPDFQCHGWYSVHAIVCDFLWKGYYARGEPLRWFKAAGLLTVLQLVRPRLRICFRIGGKALSGR